LAAISRQYSAFVWRYLVQSKLINPRADVAAGPSETTTGCQPILQNEVEVVVLLAESWAEKVTECERELGVIRT